MIEVDGRYLLLELKWQADPVSASAIAPLQHKVDRKLVGTYGLFVSISGFSEDVPDELRKGKSINVLLADDEDIFYAFSPHASLTRVLRDKFRRAAQAGVVYFQVPRWRDEDDT